MQLPNHFTASRKYYMHLKRLNMYLTVKLLLPRKQHDKKTMSNKICIYQSVINKVTFDEAKHKILDHLGPAHT